MDIAMHDLLAFYAGRDGEFAPSVKLRLLRELVADAAHYRAECESLAAQLAAARMAVVPA